MPLPTSVFGLIRTRYNTLSPNQKVIADYVLNNPRKVMLGSLNEVASACKVSETTVIRFLHKLDYASYQVFRVNLAQETSGSKPAGVYEDISTEDSTEAIMKKVLQSTVRSINDSQQVIRLADVEKMIEMIMRARKILIIGVGASAAIANDFYHKMLKLGLNVVCCNDPHLINIISMNLTNRDLLIAISHSGESREILGGVSFAREQKCQIGAITSYPRSSLANRSDCTILSSSQETEFRSDAMTSRIIQLVIIDMLHISIMVKLGEKAAENVRKSRIAVAVNKI